MNRRLRKISGVNEVFALVKKEFRMTRAEMIAATNVDVKAQTARTAASMAMRILLPDMTLIEIAMALGRTNHTTAAHAIGRGKERVCKDKAFARKMGRIIFEKV